jgi:stress-induced-phosphoprotein 1
LGKYEEAKKAYQKALELEPENIQAQKALEEIDEMTDGDLNFQNMFDDKHIMEIISKHPKLAGYMAQPDFVKKLADIQKDPKNFAK